MVTQWRAFGRPAWQVYGAVLTLSGLMAAKPGWLPGQVPSFTRRAPAGGVAFVDVSVVPMDTDRVLPHQVVVVQGDRITALGPTATTRIPAGVARINGRGKFLIPGLADMHVHVLPSPADTAPDSINAYIHRVLYAYVANGVTTVRTMGFYLGQQLLAARAQAARGELVSPRLYVAAGPEQTLSAAEAATYVAEVKAAGYDLIKLYGLDGVDLDSAAVAAHRAGIPIAGHAPSYARSPFALQRAIDAGYASIEHLFGFEIYLGSPQGWWSYWGEPGDSAGAPATLAPAQARQMLADSAKLRAIAAAIHHAGVWNCPTLAMYEAKLVDGIDWPELRYVTAATRRKYRERQDTYPTLAMRATAQAAVEVRHAVVRALRDAGAGLLLGTDTPVAYMVPGFSVHRELQAFVRAGLSPYEALATGTRNVAAYFGTLDSTGTVAAGKRADLVLLTGNPLVDIRHTMNPAGVMVRGRWLTQEDLARGLAPLEGTFPLGQN